MARFFHISPQEILRTWSVGDVVEAIRAMDVYGEIDEIQHAESEKQAKARRSGGKGWR